MTDAEIIALAGRTRLAQKRYFRERTSEALDESKRLERELDAALRARKTPDLFRDEGAAADDHA